jgi:hypothetical protein
VNEYEQQKWFELYKAAMLETERAAMTGRICDARAEMISRLEKLGQHPGAHQDECHTIQDALLNLKMLEIEEAHLAAEDKKHLMQETKQKLQDGAPKFKRPV